MPQGKRTKQKKRETTRKHAASRRDELTVVPASRTDDVNSRNKRGGGPPPSKSRRVSNDEEFTKTKWNEAIDEDIEDETRSRNTTDCANMMRGLRDSGRRVRENLSPHEDTEQDDYSDDDNERYEGRGPYGVAQMGAVDNDGRDDETSIEHSDNDDEGGKTCVPYYIQRGRSKSVSGSAATITPVHPHKRVDGSSQDRVDVSGHQPGLVPELEGIRLSGLINELFKRKKFFTSDLEMSGTSQVAHFFFTRVCPHAAGDSQLLWWDKVKNSVRKGIDSKRAAVSTAIKRKLIYMKSKNIDFDLHDFLGMRGNGAMLYFCDEFLSCVVGRLEWRKLTHVKTLNEIASASDEAFAYLVLENVWDEVMLQQDGHNEVNADQDTTPTGDRGEKNDRRHQDGRRKVILGKYTKDKYKKAAKYGGWSVLGLQRMIELKAIVEEDRKKFPNFEHFYMEHVKHPEYYGEATVKPRKKSVYSEYAGLDMSWMDDFESWPV